MFRKLESFVNFRKVTLKRKKSPDIISAIIKKWKCISAFMEQKDPLLYRMITATVRFFYRKMTVVGGEHLPEAPCVIVSNHAKMNGPIACELYFPGKHYTWCIGDMMHREDVADYAFQDFWSKKPAWIRWYYRLLSHLIAVPSEYIFTHANTIAVYKDGRALSTFKNTVKRLSEGANVIIFPEHEEAYNHILCDFQDKFVDVARLYYKRTGKALTFVPMYLAPNLGKMILAEGIAFRPDAPIDEERARICSYLQQTITETALALPRHKVVPYPNMPKKKYPWSK